MNRMLLGMIVVAAFTTAPHAKAQGAPALDIVGIKFGMPVADAMRALKADNPRMTLAPTTVSLEGFASPLMLSVIGNEPPLPAADGTIGHAGEAVELLFTLPPSPEVVWAVQRTYHFATKERSSMEATIEALLKKYGPATLPPSTDPRDRTKIIAWMYDSAGRPMGPGARALYIACGGLFAAHFGGDTASRNEIQTGQQAPKECQSVSMATAALQGGSVIPGSSQLAVDNLIVQIIDGGRHRTATEATRAVALAASKARDNKATTDLQKNGAPKL
jgi:hypothetical protein